MISTPNKGYRTNHYYSFGMVKENRNYTSLNYRYGFNGKEKDNDIKGDGNSLDFGARIYDSRLGRWLSVDNRMKDYVPISPYTFAMNNPITLLDADGRVVVDGNGNPVTVSVKQEKNGTYSTSFNFAEGTSQEIKESFNKNAGTVITAMNQTEVGRTTVNSMNSASHNISINIDKSAKYYNEKTQEYSGVPKEGFIPLYGSTENKKNDKGEITSSNITIYEGTIDKIKETPPEQIYIINIEDKVVAQSDFSKSEIIGAIGTHEGTHSTDPGSMRVLGVDAKTAEVKPNQNELKFYEQTDKTGNKVIEKKK
jgi:RHS repeat-associated protein